MTTHQAYELLVQIANQLRDEYEQQLTSRDWTTSPFGWIKATVSSRMIGKIGELLVARFCRMIELPVYHSTGDSDADLIIGKHRIEVKFSTLWAGGFYKFQQIRDQNYDYIVALGVSPHAAHCWVIPKKMALDHAPIQHGGQRGSDTRWLTVSPSSPPAWLNSYGGELSKAVELLKQL